MAQHDVRQRLEESRDRFIAALGQFGEAQWRRQPAAGVWSAAECAEHVCILEGRISKLLSSPAAGGPAANEITDEWLRDTIRSRTSRVESPEIVRPTGRDQSMAETVDEFRRQRDGLSALAEDEARLRQIMRPHPVFGPLDGRQWLLAVAAHAERHADQLDEIRAAL